MANKITGPNAGGPRQLPIRAPLATRVGQFCRSLVFEFVNPFFARIQLVTAVLIAGATLGCVREHGSRQALHKTQREPQQLLKHLFSYEDPLNKDW